MAKTNMNVASADSKDAVKPDDESRVARKKKPGKKVAAKRRTTSDGKTDKKGAKSDVKPPRTSKAGKNKVTKKKLKREELKRESGIETRKDIFRVVLAAIFLFFGIFLAVALVGNLFTGPADQSNVLSGSFNFNAANPAGSGGAQVAHYLMNNFFGFGTLVLPVFLLCLVFKLMMRGNCPIRVWVVFVHSVLIMVLTSLDATYIQHNLMPEEWNAYFAFELGGLHGKEVVGQLETLVGAMTPLILAVANLAYLSYWFTQILIWIFKGFNKLGNLLFPNREEDDGEYENAEDEVNDDEAESSDDDASDDDTEPEEAEESEEEHDEEADEGDETNDAEAEISDGEPVPVISELPEGNVSEGTYRLSLDDDDDTDEGDGKMPKVSNNVTADVAEEGTQDPDDSIELSINATAEEATANTSTVAGESDMAQSPYDPRLELTRYKFPPLNLLEPHSSGQPPTTKEELDANKKRIIQVLHNFSVEIEDINATVGPTVTLYEITPAPGVRIAKIRNLEDDIALSLSALGIRIIAPIPGKGTIGIEVPNPRPQVVSMESILNTQKFLETRYDLPIALGKTITNEIFMVDLAKMPHLLVAGATGQGKSVGLNAIITSLLYKKHPSELKLVMIDPKKVEFSMYNPIINHFLAQVPGSEEAVVTDIKQVVNTLKSLCQEMDNRYDLLKRAQCRNIKEYNAKFCARHLAPDPVDPLGPTSHKYLPYIVVIIDEFGDLIMTAGKEIELPIARIAQLARAVGIHMVIATQSPRATIITGKIKANFPARMAFRVSQGVESQTILDRRGANNLIGRGDMLFQAGSDLTRVQCAFVDTPEVVEIVKHIEAQQGYAYPFELPEVQEESDGMEGMSSTDGGSTFEQVARFVVNTQQGSTSKIQRTFSIGFNRAGRLMDQLEEAGIVGPQMGSKPREVLVHSEIELQSILTALREAGQNFE